MRFFILGSGTCVPTGLRGPSGYALLTDSAALLLDGGSGTLGRLAQTPVDYRRLSHVLYTHTHPDHTVDLVPLLFALNYTPGFERRQALRIIGPPGFEEFVTAFETPYPWIRPQGYDLQVTEADNTTLQAPGLVIESRTVEHAGIPALAYRVSADGRTLVYSGDTQPCAAIEEIARGADLLVIEASAPNAESDPGPHLTAADAGRIAHRARVGAVVLTHLYPICDGHDMAALCGEHYAGPVYIAEDLMELQLDDRGVRLAGGRDPQG